MVLLQAKLLFKKPASRNGDFSSRNGDLIQEMYIVGNDYEWYGWSFS